MMIVIVIMINVLSGMMAIKTQDIKNAGRERRVNAYYLSSIRIVGLVCF